jgi:hypothetical protein
LIVITHLGIDSDTQEQRYSVEVYGEEARLFESRVSKKALLLRDPSPEQKIREWYRECETLPSDGAVDRSIPDGYSAFYTP